MELHQLRYFAAVAELGNFTRASQRCHVSQPSLSQQIIKLERELGRPLLERLGRTAKLTEAGAAFYGRAVQILQEVEDAKACVQTSADWRAGEVSVGAILTIAPYLLPDIVRRFLKRFPKARVTVRESFTAEIVSLCLAGELDVSLVALPIEDKRLVVEPLSTEDLLLALPARHPLLARRHITLADLAEQPFILLDEIHCLGQQIVSFCRHNECLPAVTCTTAQLTTVQELVGLGQGVSLVPEMAARADKSKRRIYRCLAQQQRPQRTVALAWRRNRCQGRLIQAFMDVVRQAAGRPGAG